MSFVQITSRNNPGSREESKTSTVISLAHPATRRGRYWPTRRQEFAIVENEIRIPKWKRIVLPIFLFLIRSQFGMEVY